MPEHVDLVVWSVKVSLMAIIHTLPELKAALVNKHPTWSVHSDLYYPVSRMRLTLLEKMQLSLKQGGAES